jgi:hypothetical protein
LVIFANARRADRALAAFRRAITASRRAITAVRLATTDRTTPDALPDRPGD